MVIIDHVELIKHNCAQFGDRTVVDGSINERICLGIVNDVPKAIIACRELTFSNVQTPISKSAQVARTLPPPKKPTTRTVFSSARRRQMRLSSSIVVSGAKRRPCTTLRSQRTFSCTNATYGNTRRAFVPFSCTILLSISTGGVSQAHILLNSLSPSATRDLPPPVGAQYTRFFSPVKRPGPFRHDFCHGYICFIPSAAKLSTSCCGSS